MSSCDESSINKNYIVQTPTDFDILSACTGFYTNNIYNCTGDTLTLHSTTVSANTVNASVYLSGGTNLLDIFGSLDNYTTGATLVGTEVVFDRTNLLSAYTLNLSALDVNDTFVSGGTYNEGTTSIDFSGNSVETTFSVSLSGISSNIDIYNTYFVSPTGDDSTAVRGDLHNPFKTITAARNKVVAELSASTVTGSTLIHVYPGSYTEDEIQYENGNFYFEPGATIDQPNRGSSLIGVFNLGFTNTIQPNTYTADTCNIYGHVDINLGGGDLSVAHFMRGNSESILEFNKINIGNGFGLVPWDNAKLVAKGVEIDGQTGQYCFRAQGNSEINLNIGKVIATSTTFGLAWKSGFNGVSYVNVGEIIAPSNQIVLFTETVGVDTDIVVDYGIIKNEYSGGTSTFLVQNYQQRGGKITYRGNISIKGDNGAVYNNESTGGEINILGDIKSDSTAIQLTSSNTTGNTLNYGGNITTTNPNVSIDLDNGSIRLDGSLNGVGGTANGIDVSSGVNLSVGNFSIENVSGNSVTGTGSVEILNNLYIDKPLTVTTTGQYTFTGTTYDGDLNIYNTPINDNSLTQILGRNSVSGDVEYRDVQSIISAATSQDTFVTGYTYDDANTFTISDNSGTTFSATFNTVTGLTVNGGLSATTISACTGIYTSNLYGCSPITVNDNLILTSGLTFSSITQDNSLTQILSRDSSDGSIKYRDVESIISAATSQDTYVTGFTYDNLNTFTISDNSGSTFNTSINVLSATTISATTYFGDGSQLSGITHTTDTFISGGTYIDGGVTYNSNSIDLDNNTGGTVTITSVRDTYLTGQTFNESNYEITSTLNDGTSLISDLSILSTDMVVTGGTYDINNGVVTFTNNSGGTFNVSGFTSGMTDSFTVAANISASTESITFDNNLTGSNFYNVSLTPLLSGKTNNETFNTYTSDTQTILNSKVQDGINVGGGTGEIFSGKSGTTLNFRTLSGGSNTTLTTVGDVVKIDVAVPSGDNFFSTAGTVTQSATTSDPNISLQIVGTSGFSPYSITGITDTFVNDFTFSSNTFTITQNDGSSFDSSLETIELGNILSAVTFDIGTSGSISATTFNGDTFSGGTFYGDGSNLTGITDNDTFVTGFTYDNSNNLTISRNDGTGFTTNISTMSGLTVNGTLSATTLDGSIILSGGTNLLTIIDDRDTFVTGTTFTSNQSILSRNDGSDVLKISGGTNVTITSGGTNLTVIDVSIPLDNNTFVSGGTYSDSTDIITFTNTTGGTFNVTGITDTFVTGGTYSSGTTSLDFSGNTGFIPFSVNVSELIDDTNTFVTGFTYNDANTFTISNNNGTNYSASIDVMSGLTVNGESVFSGTGTDVVQIYGSGDTTPIFRVEGSAGELFSISDSLIGDLFTVNNISGLPILVVNSDNTILWGDNTVPSLNTTVKSTINSGSTEIYSIPVSAYTGGFFDYTVTGAGARAGSITSIFSGTSVQFNETTTNDIGDTSGITFDMNISGGTANLTVSATTNSWEIRTIVRSI